MLCSIFASFSVLSSDRAFGKGRDSQRGIPAAEGHRHLELRRQSGGNQRLVEAQRRTFGRFVRLRGCDTVSNNISVTRKQYDAPRFCPSPARVIRPYTCRACCCCCPRSVKPIPWWRTFGPKSGMKKGSHSTNYSSKCSKLHPPTRLERNDEEKTE